LIALGFQKCLHWIGHGRGIEWVGCSKCSTPNSRPRDKRFDCCPITWRETRWVWKMFQFFVFLFAFTHSILVCS
jgi:hypothetical protein